MTEKRLAIEKNKIFSISTDGSAIFHNNFYLKERLDPNPNFFGF
jgi:hypothetical protein